MDTPRHAGIRADNKMAGQRVAAGATSSVPARESSRPLRLGPRHVPLLLRSG